MDKKVIFFIGLLFFTVIPQFADDWIPLTKVDEEFMPIPPDLFNEICTNGTFLSGTNDFSFYLTKKNEDFIIAIIYKETCQYYDFGNIYRYRLASGFFNFSIENINDPVIIFYYSSYHDLYKSIITFNGKKFIINTYDVKNIMPGIDQQPYAKFINEMNINLKSYYLHGKRVNYNCFYDASLESEGEHHIFSFNSEEYKNYSDFMNTCINDERVRIRTKNSINSSTIEYSKIWEKIRIIEIDPIPVMIEGRTGFWVLVETENMNVGWIFSSYIKNFDFDFK